MDYFLSLRGLRDDPDRLRLPWYPRYSRSSWLGLVWFGAWLLHWHGGRGTVPSPGWLWSDGCHVPAGKFLKIASPRFFMADESWK